MFLRLPEGGRVKPRFPNCTLFANAVRETLAAMTARKLRRAFSEIPRMKDSNCDWLLYALREPLNDLLQNELRARDKRRRQRLLPL